VSKVDKRKEEEEEKEECKREREYVCECVYVREKSVK